MSFTGLDKGGKDAAFNGLTLVKSGSGADAIADAAADDGVPLGVKILAVLQLILYIAVVLFIVGHMFLYGIRAHVIKRFYGRRNVE